jgi:membrane protein implicated in regulation of membrane protease activity
MKLIWVWEKMPALLAFLIGLGFVGVSVLDAQYRYLYILLAILAFYYGYRYLKRKETPFERKEREMRNRFGS